ncbi:MAG: multidrug effflux MFS transporter [Rhodospirillum sp.]|nr:multidrug effflux MFS transporter [Rhodospirillum sp.]MCF8489273.1 multidrug effflux MFS transporter [Rhodospirillum sp.]
MSNTPSPSPRFGMMSRPEFIGMMAMMIALTALSIDVMLVALPDIALAYNLTDPNDQQLVIISYMIGFSLGQPLWGPLSDAVGRKPVLYAGFAIYAVAAVAAALSSSFEMLLIARFIQGVGGASPRILSMAIVRDYSRGTGMAKAMSTLMTVFIIIPVLAPSLGGLILALTNWRWLFSLLAVVCLGLFLWSIARLEESHPASKRAATTATGIWLAARTVVTTRTTVGYTLCVGFMLGMLMGYVSTAQQIFVDVYHQGTLFPVLFGVVASAIALASILNSRFVVRVGIRRMCHTALVAFVVLGSAMGMLGFPGHPPLWLFMTYMFLGFFCFGFVAPNANALSMEPMGRIAGMASSFVGFLTSFMGAGLGGYLGQHFDGSVRPLVLGFLIFGLLALASVLVTEKGNLWGKEPERDYP